MCIFSFFFLCCCFSIYFDIRLWEEVGNLIQSHLHQLGKWRKDRKIQIQIVWIIDHPMPKQRIRQSIKKFLIARIKSERQIVGISVFSNERMELPEFLLNPFFVPVLQKNSEQMFHVPNTIIDRLSASGKYTIFHLKHPFY